MYWTRARMPYDTRTLGISYCDCGVRMLRVCLWWGDVVFHWRGGVRRGAD